MKKTKCGFGEMPCRQGCGSQVLHGNLHLQQQNVQSVYELYKSLVDSFNQGSRHDHYRANEASKILMQNQVMFYVCMDGMYAP